MLYFVIDATTHEVVGSREGEFVDYNDKASSVANGKNFLTEVTITEPAFDSATEKLIGPVDSYDYLTDVATRVYTKVAKTQAELDADQLFADTVAVRQSQTDTVMILIQLFDNLLADNVIAANDFEGNVWQAYQDLKVIADRIITNQ